MHVEPIDPARLERHLTYLCTALGVRVAGSASEEAAAAYVEKHFCETGAQVRVETFPAGSRYVEDQCLEVLLGETWQSFPCSLFSSSPGTGGARLEGELVFFEAPAEYQRKDLTYLKGKAVLHLGCHIESRQNYRRLIEAQPAFLMLVDVRYPGTEVLADGLFPAYTRAIGAVPTVNVAYQHAWKWRAEGGKAARLHVVGGMRESSSQNVVAELAGEQEEQILFVGAHHDTQADSPGADDNASGVAGILELARVLAPLARRRTLRLISFGAEEQLSLGSARYVRRHRDELRQRSGLIVNFDSFGSPLGWNEFVLNGPRELLSHVRDHFHRNDVYVRITSSVMPYADHFPFVAAGLPGISAMRPNCHAGRFFHHRRDDDLTRVCPHTMARILNAAATLLADLATRPSLPFTLQIPAEQRGEVAHLWEDLFGGWSA